MTRISPQRRRAIDTALAYHVGLSLEDAVAFRPTENWNSFGAVLQNAAVLDLAPSLYFDAEFGVWNIRLHGAQDTHAMPSELLARWCEVVAIALKLPIAEAG